MTTEIFDSVWDALEDPPTEAENMKLRSNLMVAISEAVSGWRVTQAEAASRLGIKAQNSPIHIKHLKVKAITTCILRVDEKMLAMPYLYAYQTQDSPRYLLRGNTRIFEKYQTEFNELFAIAEDV